GVSRGAARPVPGVARRSRARPEWHELCSVYPSMIEMVSGMDKPVAKPKGLSRAARIAAVAGAAALLLVAAALPTIRRWVRAERSVAASQVRIGEVTRGTLVRATSADGRIVPA